MTHISFKAKMRFFKKIVSAKNGCHEWTGAKNGKGYGRFGLYQYNMYAHRVAWLIEFGNIPDGMLVLHKCDNPCCVNPEHLFLGTNADNMADMVAKGRSPNTAGERNPTAKLTEAAVSAIRSDTRPIQTIAKEYEVTYQNIWRIQNNYTWRTGH